MEALAALTFARLLLVEFEAQTVAMRPFVESHDALMIAWLFLVKSAKAPTIARMSLVASHKR